MYNGTYDLENYLRHVDRMDENAKRSGCKGCGGQLLEAGDEFCSGICFNEYERDN
jgi:hypothetical protein